MSAQTTVKERSAMQQMLKQSNGKLYDRAKTKAQELGMPLGHYIASCVAQVLGDVNPDVYEPY